jgi:hypothetical protein
MDPCYEVVDRLKRDVVDVEEAKLAFEYFVV